MITIVTDFKAHGFWIAPGHELYVGMCEATRQDLMDWGIEREKIVLWGIPTQIKFRQHAGRSLLTKELGLAEGRFTFLLTSGSFGIGPSEQILEVLQQKGSHIQAIVVTGNNKEAYARLSKKTYPFPVKVYGYVENMDQLMEVSDLAIVKPGGITVSELLVKGCPFLMLKPIPGQEEGNGEVLLLEGVSQFIQEPEELAQKWSLFENPEKAKKLRENISKFARPEASLRLVEYLGVKARN